MSLLINALKKFRHESSPSLPTEGGDINTAVKTSKAKKIVLISVAAILLVALTAMTTFFIFKQVEKARIAKVMQGKMGKMQEMMSGRQDNATASDAAPSAENKEDLRARLQQKMQGGKGVAQKKQTNAASASESSAVLSVSASEPSLNSAADASFEESVEPEDSSNSEESVEPEDVSSSEEISSDEEVSSEEEASSEETAPSIDENSVSSTKSVVSDFSSNVNEDNGSSGTVNIQKVSDKIGANNPTYQQALNFTQLTQYDKAIPLLVNNDKLIIETQGLAALLLAKIYIMTNQYDLADDVLEHATQLNAGSSVEVVALRAQSKFMQQRYQQVVDLLGPQSPDLSSFPGYYALLAAAYMRLDQPSNAVSIFQQIVAKFPTSANYWLGLALAYQKSGDVNSALIAYRRAAQLSESDPQVLLFINQQLHTLQAT